MEQLKTAAIACIVAVLAVYLTSRTKTYEFSKIENFHETNISKLKQSIRTYKGQNDSLTKVLESLRIKLSESQKKADKYADSLHRLKQKADEKIDDVNNYNSDELYRFFTERYRAP